MEVSSTWGRLKILRCLRQQNSVLKEICCKSIFGILTCLLPEFFFPFYSLLWMGVIMSINAASRHFSPESNAALIDTDDFFNGVMDSRWTIITLVTVLAQLLVHSSPVGIYPYFNEWWSASSMKVTHVDKIFFPALSRTWLRPSFIQTTFMSIFVKFI